MPNQINQNVAFKGNFLVRLPGKKGETFLTKVVTDKSNKEILEISGKGIYKGKETGDSFKFADPKGLSDETLATLEERFFSKFVKNGVDATLEIFKVISNISKK